MKRGKEVTCKIPDTTVLKLFVYPGKDGMISSYPTTYCVGIERRNGDFVSQTFLTDWEESYTNTKTKLARWEQVLGCNQPRYNNLTGFLEPDTARVKTAAIRALTKKEGEA